MSFQSACQDSVQSDSSFKLQHPINMTLRLQTNLSQIDFQNVLLCAALSNNNTLMKKILDEAENIVANTPANMPTHDSF